METYNGHVRTPTDAIILFEACRLGLLPRVQRRLSEKERQSIRSGSVFVWDEREAGMRRWTDGKSWSASRVSGSFLTYREMEGKRGGNNFVQPNAGRSAAKTPDSGRGSADEPADGEEGPDGYRYKPDGLMKQSFSITTSQNQHLHLISYYSRSHPTAPNLRQPSTDATLASIQIPKGMYPESTINDQSNTPAVTRSPMPGAPNYVMAPSPTYPRHVPPPPYPYYPGLFPHPGYPYPISPMHTPPGSYALHAAYAHAAAAAGLPPLGHPPSPYGHHPPPPPPQPSLAHSQPPSLAFDQRPLRTSLTAPPPLNRAPSSPTGASFRPPPSPTGPINSQQSQAPSLPPPAPTASAPPTAQVDPRLNENAQPRIAESGRPEIQSHENKPADSTVATTASQTPSIGALVNSANLATVSAAIAAAAPAIQAKDRESDRQGSISPGGTKRSVPPQDIPSEKLGFREDMRALSKLDRVFARV